MRALFTTVVVALLLAAGGARTDAFAKRESGTSRIDVPHHVVATIASIRRHSPADSELRLPPFACPRSFGHERPSCSLDVDTLLAPAIAGRPFRFTRSSRGPPVD